MAETIPALGRYGSNRPDGPGVTLRLRGPLSIFAVIARKGKKEALAAAMRERFGLALPGPGLSSASDGRTLRWAGPEQWFALAEVSDGAFGQALAGEFADIAAVVDQSHGRVAIVIAGAKARAVLAKGTAVDLDPSRFRPGQVAATQMAHVGVHIAAVVPDAFELLVFRSFAESLFAFLAAMAGEYGYEVTAPPGSPA